MDGGGKSPSRGGADGACQTVKKKTTAQVWIQNLKINFCFVHSCICSVVLCFLLSTDFLQ